MTRTGKGEQLNSALAELRNHRLNGIPMQTRLPGKPLQD